MSGPTLTEQVALLGRLTSKSMSDMQHEVLEGIVDALPRYEAALALAEAVDAHYPPHGEVQPVLFRDVLTAYREARS